MDISLEDTQKKLDKALKRNLEGQAKAIDVSAKLPEPQISKSDQITETED